MNKTALTKTYTKDIQNFCLNSKKIVLSLATISFSASCTHAVRGILKRTCNYP